MLTRLLFDKKNKIMKTLLSALLSLTLFTAIGFSQFSQETKKYIEYDDAVIVLKNGLLIDGKGNRARANQTVIIKNGKIESVGDDAKVKIPAGAKVIDLNGKAIMPGLVMLHEHMYISAFSFDPGYAHARQLPVTFPRLYFASGATTVRTAGNVEPFSDLRIKKDIDAGNFPGPSMEITAPYLEGKSAMFPQMNELDGPKDATSFVNYWADERFTSFKAYMGIEKLTLKAAIDAVHKRKLKITGHLCSVTYREAAEMGIDNLEHGFLASTDFVSSKKENECPPENEVEQSLADLDLKSEKVKSLLEYLIDQKVGVTSTLAVFEGFTTTQPKPSDDLLSMFSPDSRDFYLKVLPTITSQKSPSVSDKAFVSAAKMEKMFFDIGGLLTVGTDPTGNGGTIAGYGNWRAIELLVEARRIHSTRSYQSCHLKRCNCARLR